MVLFYRLALACTLLFYSVACYSFRPVAHVVIQRTISEKLPKNNRFKAAMEKHPEFAAWGAVGPDLSYVPIRPLMPKFGYKRKMAKQLNNADIAHYFKTGEFCTALIKRAINSKDDRLVAFAAGWVTHVAGDFGAHGIFIYPEAGYYINNIEGRAVHAEMEQYAEPLIFIEKGSLLTNNPSFYRDENIDCSRLYENFFHQKLHFFSGFSRKKEIKEKYEPTVIKLLDEIFNDLYHHDLKTNFAYGMSNYDEAFGKGLSLREFDLKNYDQGLAFFKDSTLKKDLDDAFDYAIDYGVRILIEANAQNFNSYTSTWNLDIGEFANTIVVKCVIDEESQRGTTLPIWMKLRLKTARSVSINYNFFKKIRYKRGDILFAYVYLNECDVDEDEIYSFQLYKKGLHDETVIQDLVVYFNGKVIYMNKDKIYLNRKQPETKSTKFYEPFVLVNED